MKRNQRVALVLFAAAGLLGAFSATRTTAQAPRSLAERLLGPIADLAAAVEWVRADVAWRHGRMDLFDARAATALRLAPSDPSGWATYAHHLVFDRPAPLGLGPRERRLWVEAGLDVLARGERESRGRGALAFQRGIVFLYLAQFDDEDRPLAITRTEAWLSAAEAFDRAATLGEPFAAEAAQAARDAATDTK